MEKKTTNILIPFDGFYESIPSQRAEDIAFYNYIQEKDVKNNPITGWMDRPEDMSDAEQEDFWDNYYPEKIDEIRKQICIDYISNLGIELDLEMTFESISSPRQYNYTTDRLFVDVPTDQLIALYNKVKHENLAEMIKERHTSYDGFSSYYENDIQDPSWQDPALYDHNQWQTVLEAYIKQENINISEIYYI